VEKLDNNQEACIPEEEKKTLNAQSPQLRSAKPLSLRDVLQNVNGFHHLCLAAKPKQQTVSMFTMAVSMLSDECCVCESSRPM